MSGEFRGIPLPGEVRAPSFGELEADLKAARKEIERLNGLYAQREHLLSALKKIPHGTYKSDGREFCNTCNCATVLLNETCTGHIVRAGLNYVRAREVTDCSICRGSHGREITHASE